MLVGSCHLMTHFLLSGFCEMEANYTGCVPAQCQLHAGIDAGIHMQPLSSRSQEEISLKPAILLWGLQSQGKREWGVRNSWDSACATYKQELMSSKLNFHAAFWYISLLSPSPLFSLYLPAPPILLSYSKRYIFWLPLAPQICQEVSY